MRRPRDAGGRAVARPAVIRGTNGYVVQLPPFSVNAVGAASLDVQVPWKPTDVEPPGAIVPPPPPSAPVPRPDRAPPGKVP